MSRALKAWWADRLVGTLAQAKGGSLEFAYAKDWIDDDRTPSLSLSLPKRDAAFREKECRPFFAGLLPEETQRRLAAQALGISEGNDFALLDELGGEVAGAIQLLPTDLTPRFESHDLQADALDDAALVAVLDKLPLRPFLAGEDGLRLSLAGAQSKLPVVLVGNKVALPRPGQPTTHILKPPIPDYPGTTENEALVMRLARAIGLNVADAEPRIVANKTFLLITRYDRTLGMDGHIERLHQEDFCQALGILPHRKYANEGGPDFKTSFALVRQASAMPARDVLALMDAALFNLIVGNADAHGKNFSLLHGSNDTRLAPLYDLLSTIQYPTLSPNLAMKIGRAGGLDELDDEAWRCFSADTGVGLPYIRRRGNELCEKISEALPDVGDWLSSSGLASHHIDAVMRTIADRLAIAPLRLPSGKAKSGLRKTLDPHRPS